MEYDVTPFVTHRGGRCEFNSVEKGAKELKDTLNNLKMDGHKFLGIVALQADWFDNGGSTYEDGYLIITEHDPHN